MPDPRYEWIDITTVADPEPVYMRGRCLHIHRAPVHLLTGGHVADICETCHTTIYVEPGEDPVESFPATPLDS